MGGVRSEDDDLLKLCDFNGDLLKFGPWSWRSLSELLSVDVA